MRTHQVRLVQLSSYCRLVVRKWKTPFVCDDESVTTELWWQMLQPVSHVVMSISSHHQFQFLQYSRLQKNPPSPSCLENLKELILLFNFSIFSRTMIANLFAKSFDF
jgi:hypothetical protein